MAEHVGFTLPCVAWHVLGACIISWASFQDTPPNRAVRTGKGELKEGEGKRANGNCWSLLVLTILLGVKSQATAIVSREARIGH